MKQEYSFHKAVFYTLISCLGFALMSFFIRQSGNLPVMQKAFFRNFVALIISAASLLSSRQSIRWKKGNGAGLLARCAFGTAGLLANFWAVDHMVLADANMLNKMSPFFAILMSIPVLKEYPSEKDVILTAIAFLGVVCIVRPSAGLASFPAFVGLFSGFSAGTAYTFLREITTNGEDGKVIVFCFSLFSCLCTLPSLLFDYRAMTGSQLLSLFLAGASAAAAQFAVTAAYRYAPAKDVSVFNYSQVLFAAVIGWLFLQEVPDAMSFLGYAIIIGASFFKWMDARKENTQ